MPLIDWSTDEQRIQFEKDLKAHRGIKKKYSWIQWLLWFSGVIILPVMLVLCFYGPVAYTIVNDQRNIDSEQSIKMDRHTSDNITNYSHDSMLNAIKRNFYFLTVTCQGMAFILCVAFHYTSYKWWSFLGGMKLHDRAIRPVSKKYLAWLANTLGQHCPSIRQRPGCRTSQDY